MVTGEKISVRTPLIYSQPLSDIAGRDVYLKLENTQPSGSFKLRGLSHLCKEKYAEGCTKLIGSSGGNAGLALAYAANKLGVPCQIFVPTYVVPRMLKKIQAYGAEVTIGGIDWQEANDQAMAELKKDPNFAIIPPFDHPSIWEGNSTMISEIKEDLKGRRPGCVAVSVGGGGLLMGVLTGLEREGWKDVPVLALETVGAECFNLSVKANKLVEITLTSIAKTLGARSVTPQLLEKYKDFNVISEVLPDKDAVHGCVRFADDHQMLVEPSCGVTMAAVYSKLLPSVLNKYGYDSSSGPLVLVICGGSDISQDILQNFINTFGMPCNDVE
ncbi:L-serine dehydratase/L-threonine deaminase [Folsomia candida]|uniref:L-serine dehydratase/L-threonine deaminase n=1 Tax=Folsomia candida TaxID=158441 RepID=UPI000B8FB365|nr:L-serine dehydratase/L-threonine deaminase [Folsomia candida]